MAISVCRVEKNEENKEILPRENPGFPIACYEDNMRVISVPIHWHDEYEFIAAVEGKVTVQLGTDELVLREGDGVFINSGCLHAVRSVAEGVSLLRSLVILPKLVGGSSDCAIWQRLVTPLSAPGAPAYLPVRGEEPWQRDVTSLMLGAWKAVTEETYDFENEARYRISKALRILTDHSPAGQTHTQKNDLAVSRMKILLSYIEEHYAEDLCSGDLAALCSCSESVLLRCFRQIAGTSPMQYLLNFRIEKAAEKLRTTGEKSGSIALSCGFHDFSYFIKVFRRSMGMTPAAYRKKAT